VFHTTIQDPYPPKYTHTHTQKRMTDDDDDDDDIQVRNAVFQQFNAANTDEERERVRVERVQMQDTQRRRPLVLAGIVLCIVSIVFIVTGLVQMSNAEYERHRGWLLTSCSVEMKYGADDDKCIYFSVRVNVERYDNQSLCAVPAALATEAWFHEPPACSHLDRASQEDIDYWKTIGSAQVECYVPAPELTLYPVTADECTSSVVTSNPSNVVWRSWIGRFVYLVRRPREGVTAIEQLTRTQFNVGTLLLIIGIILQVIGGCLACNKLVSECFRSEYPPRITRFYRQRRAAAHKLY